MARIFCLSNRYTFKVTGFYFLVVMQLNWTHSGTRTYLDDEDATSSVHEEVSTYWIFSLRATLFGMRFLFLIRDYYFKHANIWSPNFSLWRVKYCNLHIGCWKRKRQFWGRGKFWNRFISITLAQFIIFFHFRMQLYCGSR